MEGFDMDFNMDDLPEMPSFNMNGDFNMNSDFNMDGIDDLGAEGLDDLSDISVDGKPFVYLTVLRS